MPNYKQMYAIKEAQKKRIKTICPTINNNSGIYVFYRVDEVGIKHCYCGQAKHICDRCVQHLFEYDHIGLSLKKRKFYSEDNPYGWKLIFKNCPEDELDENEKKTIKYYADNGFQLYNVTAGGQGNGKIDINERKPTKGYQDGLKQGYKNASKEMAHLFDLHLEVSTKKTPPTVNQQKALDKFREFLEYYKEN